MDVQALKGEVMLYAIGVLMLILAGIIVLFGWMPLVNRDNGQMEGWMAVLIVVLLTICGSGLTS